MVNYCCVQGVENKDDCQWVGEKVEYNQNCGRYFYNDGDNCCQGWYWCVGGGYVLYCIVKVQQFGVVKKNKQNYYGDVGDKQ